MRVIFLGTSGSMPTPERGNSSVAVKMGRQIVLLDCGEGTQRQMTRARLSILKVSLILLTHLHGDHVLGLPGLLQSMTLLQREDPLRIVGTRGTHAFLQAVCNSLGGPGFPVEVHEVAEPGVVHDAPGYTVEAARAQHRVEAWSFGLFEKPRRGRFHPDEARKLGVPAGPLWKILQDGGDVETDGRTIHSADVVDPPRSGRRLVYSGDTTPRGGVLDLARGADVLIHEATFTHDLAERAAQDGHTTARQAAETAAAAGVKKLILTHLSSRYADPEPLLREALEVFPETVVAADLLVFEVPLPA